MRAFKCFRISFRKATASILRSFARNSKYFCASCVFKLSKKEVFSFISKNVQLLGLYLTNEYCCVAVKVQMRRIILRNSLNCLCWRAERDLIKLIKSIKLSITFFRVALSSPQRAAWLNFGAPVFYCSRSIHTAVRQLRPLI